MTGISLIFLFVILLAVPSFYIVLRGIFPSRSKRAARLWSYLLTALLVFMMYILIFAKL